MPRLCYTYRSFYLHKLQGVILCIEKADEEMEVWVWGGKWLLCVSLKRDNSDILGISTQSKRQTTLRLPTLSWEIPGHEGKNLGNVEFGEGTQWEYVAT